MKRLFWAGSLLLLALMTACSEPPAPPGIQLAIDQELDLRRAGAPIYAPEAFAEFQQALKAGQEQFSQERTRLLWLRDYQRVADTFQTILGEADQVRLTTARNRELIRENLGDRASQLAERLQALRDLAVAVKDSRLNSSGLARVTVLLTEARHFIEVDAPETAMERLADAERHLEQIVQKIRPILNDYVDAGKIARWKAQVAEVVAESRRSGGQVIVVNKLRRQLLLYKGGTQVATYPVGLGFRPIGDKLYSGDRATPEGRYQIVGKLPNSKFYRALLINYPNDEDWRRFQQAKKRREIPASARIGGQIEIHGGGKEGATYGCIGLDDEQMLDLYNRVAIGTPIVIVAATSRDNLVSIALGQLE